mgnify:CR=1 FL=1
MSKKSGSRERWVTVAGFPAYEVSNLGRVRSWWRRGAADQYQRQGEPKVLTPTPEPSGLLYLMLYAEDGVYTRTAVARLVLSNHKAPPADGEIVGYKDGNPSNVAVTNLCWTTRAAAAKANPRPAEKRLTAKVVKGIRKVYEKSRDKKTGEPRRGVMVELAREHGLSRTTISDIVHYRTWIDDAAA